MNELGSIRSSNIRSDGMPYCRGSKGQSVQLVTGNDRQHDTYHSQVGVVSTSQTTMKNTTNESNRLEGELSDNHSIITIDNG